MFTAKMNIKVCWILLRSAVFTIIRLDSNLRFGSSAKLQKKLGFCKTISKSCASKNKNVSGIWTYCNIKSAKLKKLQFRKTKKSILQPNDRYFRIVNGSTLCVSHCSRKL